MRVFILCKKFDDFQRQYCDCRFYKPIKMDEFGHVRPDAQQANGWALGDAFSESGDGKRMVIARITAGVCYCYEANPCVIWTTPLSVMGCNKCQTIPTAWFFVNDEKYSNVQYRFCQCQMVRI